MLFTDATESRIVTALRAAPHGLTETCLLPISGLPRPDLAARLDDPASEGLLKRGKAGAFLLSDELHS
jgi:hypothetical protein